MIDTEQYCKEKTASSGSSFYYSFMFLPKNQQNAISAVYAFCREIDDIVDECKEKSIALQKLLWWQKEVNKIYIQEAEHPVGKALEEHVKDFSLPKELFIKIIEGMHMDLDYHGYKEFSDLKLYCHCVAGAVGLLAAKIFGYTEDKTLEYARNLGISFQIINIIRDVGEDARRGRIYIPEEDLARFDISAEELLSLKVENSDNLNKLLKFQAERAREYYKKAIELLPACDRYTQKSGLIMAKIYFTILDEIEKDDFKVLNQRISITPIRKIWLAWRENRKEQNIYKDFKLSHVRSA